ncbi:MAG TPA: 30S ribosomal protein S9 [bacterium]|jgi:small subunit ribosomal protein S9|nr:30S ribosomal protein S9 [bacterium]HOG38018.1 30S ribosomal protein S9 [bacterium]
MATNKEQYQYGIGRRKEATCSVRLYQEKGEITVNDKSLNEYFKNKNLVDLALESLKVLNLIGKYRITIKTSGGGIKSQAESIRLAIARSLIKIDPEYKKTLKSAGLLTRDPRSKERKKPGLKKARRAPQWSKR